MAENETITNEKVETKNISQLKRIGLPLVAVVTALLILSGGFYGYLYASTPSHLRYPEYEHYHIRTQIVADGELVDFSRSEFQEDYDATTCSADITGQPVDFHDDQDQMAHVHWRGISGGEFLKFYGWNLLGGDDSSLGKRYDQGMMNAQSIEVAGNLLPQLKDDTNFYVYIGDKDNYEQKDWEEFLGQDLEEFMGKKSYLNTSDEASYNPFGLFTQKAFAHGNEVDEHAEPVDGENDEARLERINNLLGNVVIFAQSEEPTTEQVKERFNNLTPLHDSVCGG